MYVVFLTSLSRATCLVPILPRFYDFNICWRLNYANFFTLLLPPQQSVLVKVWPLCLYVLDGRWEDKRFLTEQWLTFCKFNAIQQERGRELMRLLKCEIVSHQGRELQKHVGRKVLSFKFKKHQNMQLGMILRHLHITVILRIVCKIQLNSILQFSSQSSNWMFCFPTKNLYASFSLFKSYA